MSEDELDRVIAALRAGRRFSMYGADGEWGYECLPDGRFRGWTHDPGADVSDTFPDEAQVRGDLRVFDYATVMARLQ